MYGKTVCKDIEEIMLFTTEKELYKEYCTKDLIDAELCETDQVLVRMKINEDTELLKEAPKALKNANKQQTFPTLIGSYILAYSR